MPISDALAGSLPAIASTMAVAEDRWWIIGSAAVALHGADLTDVRDVDIVLSIADAARILSHLGIAPDAGAGHPDFRSRIFATWGGAALPVEFMADFHCRSRDRWLPVQPTTRIAISGEGWTVFVPDKDELGAILAMFGRPKDIERRRRLTALG